MIPGLDISPSTGFTRSVDTVPGAGAARGRRWASAIILMLVWWVVNYGFGALPIDGMQPAWFPQLGVLLTNVLSLAVTWTTAIALHRAGWLGPDPLRLLAGWQIGAPRRLWLLLPMLAVALGYVWIGRDGVPGLVGSPETMTSLAIGMLAVGLSEETASRGIPLGTLARGGEVWAGALVTSVLFGLWHLGNGIFFGSSAEETWWQVLGATAFGLCFAGARLVVGALWPLVLLHALGDWTQLLSPGAAPLWYQIAVMAFHAAWGVLLIALALRRPAGDITGTATGHRAPRR